MRRELAAVVYVSLLASSYKLSMENIQMEWNSCEISFLLLTIKIMTQNSISFVRQIASCMFRCRRQMYLGSRDHAR